MKPALQNVLNYNVLFIEQGCRYAGCQLNSPAEKEVIAGWILASDHLVNNERFLGYTRTIILYLNHVKLSKSTK